MLPPKRERFCKEYVIDLNGAQAAMRAGYCTKNADAAASTASRLLRDVKVSARIAELQAKVEKKLDLSLDWVLTRMMKLADADMAQAFHKDGSLKSIHDMPENVRFAIQEIEHRKKIKLSDKKSALDSLLKYLGDKPPSTDTKPVHATEMTFVMNVADGDGVEYDKPHKQD